MYLIQYSEVKGDQNIGKFRDCFKVLLIDYSAGRSTIQAPIGSNQRHFGSIQCSPIQVAKYVCKASRALHEACHFGKASECKLLFLDSSNTEYLEITLTDALFSNYHFKAHGDIPRETFDITYTAISLRHVLKDSKGSIASSSTTSFNLTKNTK